MFVGVTVPEKFMEERPPHYTNITSHITEYNEERQNAHKKKSRQKNEKVFWLILSIAKSLQVCNWPENL